MTKREFLKNEVLKALKEKLGPYGFKLKKTACEFVQKTKFGWNKYQIVFLLRDQGWELKPCLLTRFDVVEDLYHQISSFEKKYQKETPTLGTSIEDLYSDGPEARFNLFEEGQVDIVVDKLFDLFKSAALQFFNKYDTLEAADYLINGNIENTSMTGSIFKGIKGLILAKLLNRKDFETLDRSYYNYYRLFSDGYYFPEYDKLRNFLSDNIVTH